MDLCRARGIWEKKRQGSDHDTRGDEIAESIIADYEAGIFLYSIKEKKPTSSVSTPSKTAKKIQSSDTASLAPEDDESDEDDDDDDSEAFSYGLPDIPSFIANNAKAWGGNLPDEDDWNKIRFEGSQAKEWPLNIAFEAAFREFSDKGADVHVDTRQITAETEMTRLLAETLKHIRSHYDNMANKSGKNVEGKKLTFRGDSSLIRTTKDAELDITLLVKSKKTLYNLQIRFYKIIQSQNKVV